MKVRSINLSLLCALLLTLFIGCGDSLAQEGKVAKVEGRDKVREFCAGDSWNGDKVQFKELRESTVSAGGVLTVDGGKNGGIRVIGENRSDVLVRACVQAWATTAEAAQAMVKGVKVNTGSTIKADGAGEDWGVSYEIHVPRVTDLNLTAHNGGIHISSVEGNLDFRTLNGGLHLSEIAGNVKGRTTNGGVHVELSGGSWKGSGLDLETTNGGVHLSVPQNFAAHFETGTVNGGFHSDFAQLELPKSENGEKRRPGGRISADVNGGGAPVRLMTTNGGVHIGSDDDERED
jgi:hypothetical protein